MKYLAPILVLLAFTDPQGFPVWIVSGEVSSVQRAVNCSPLAATRIMTSAGQVCVREPVDEVVKQLGGSNERSYHDLLRLYRP